MSREQLKGVLGGYTGTTGGTDEGTTTEAPSGPCKNSSQTTCTTGDGEAGTCKTCHGVWGCVPVGVKCEND